VGNSETLLGDHLKNIFVKTWGMPLIDLMGDQVVPC